MIPSNHPPNQVEDRFAVAPLNSVSAPHLRLNDNVEESETGSVFPECAMQVICLLKNLTHV